MPATNPTQPTGAAVGYANFAQYVAQTMYAANVGSVPSIPNPLATSQLDTSILTDPVRIGAYRSSIARQLNDGSYGPRFLDLEDRIADVTITTSAQGASTLEVTLIDPLWVIPQSGFIQADATGYLQPLDVQFPTDAEITWRLVQYRPSWTAEMDTANLVLTFEDRIVSFLRQVSPGNGGVSQGQPNQTLIAFFAQLVSSANTFIKGPGVTPIQFVPLIAPDDPNAEIEITQLPKRALRKVQPTGLNAQLQKVLHDWGRYQLGAFPSPGLDSTITQTEHNITRAWRRFLQSPHSAITVPVP